MGKVLNYMDTAALMKHSVHGTHVPKTGIVCHETVSPDLKGWGDITGVEKYLAKVGYGIHGMTDLEGHKAWASGLGSAIFYHAGGANEETIGIENVSKVMLAAPTNKARKAIWLARQVQLNSLAQMIAAIHNTKPHEVPLKFWDGAPGGEGVTSHWNISQHHSSSEGHTDCWPVHEGGYFPIMYVIYRARIIAKTGVHL